MMRIAILTSGGDSPGMNAAVRAIARTAITSGARPYGVSEGLQGLVDDQIRELAWRDVSGILSEGGTFLGTARSAAFRTVEGRQKAVCNLVNHGIDRLVVCGGDGSLTGSNILVDEWPEHLQALVSEGKVSQETAARHPRLFLVGLPGSIDNDLCGSDTTIGADTALHRIVAAVDAIFSTADSHQRTFVIEVMGRNCGYLALIAGLAIGAEGLLIPEAPPGPDWAEELVARLEAGKAAGRRSSMVIVAEGARDIDGNRISCDAVKKALEARLGDVRVTILGHVQRGGAPSAFDRNLSTLLGHTAAKEALKEDFQPCLVGLRNNRPAVLCLKEVLATNASLVKAIQDKDLQRIMELRGKGFSQAYDTWKTLVQAQPEKGGRRGRRIGILHAGGPAPGMNMAARAAVRLALDAGHTVFGIRNGFKGLVEGKLEDLGWMSVSGWANKGGAELGTSRYVPDGADLYSAARTLEDNKLDGLLMIGGWAGYASTYKLYQESKHYPAFNLPIVCVPATIDNNLPSSELSVGSDTALNCIVEAVDRIKRSAVANNRCFVVEVMGGRCGYLALMSGLATGAEKVYLHELGVRVRDLMKDLDDLSEGFRAGDRVGLTIRNEHANPFYSTPFIAALFEEEGGDLFDVRQAILGHLQQGGDPSPFDRASAIRLARAGVHRLLQELESDEPQSGYLGYGQGEVNFTDIHLYPRQIDEENRRPKTQWWMKNLEVAKALTRASESRRTMEMSKDEIFA